MNDAHILLVEDDTYLLSGMRDLLEIEGYHVSCGVDGMDALRVLGEMVRPPDLVISDIRMPNMDGYQFLTSLRSHQEWLLIPFIFLTAKGQKEDISYGKLLGVEDYITKPFDFGDLLVSVKSTLIRHEQRVQWQEQRIDSLRQQILMVLHHEFRTPLSYIVAYSDLLLSTPAFASNPEMSQLRDGIISGSDRLTALIENFLILAELESGFGNNIYTTRRTMIQDMQFLVPRIIDELSHKAAEQGVEVVYQSNSSIPSILADEVYLKAAIKQLIDNAIKFSPKKQNSSVHVHADVEQEELVISVTDHGIGIPEEEIDLLFDPFYQINRKKNEQQGSGAGLAIVRHVTMLHQGKVEVESQPNEGASFRLRIPVVTSPEEVSQPA